MLVLHPSSSCDVCLDAYTWETPERTPHAIPCGHVFCRICLENVHPSNCPLCRKAFNSERVKKLHVSRPENGDEEKEVDLLQRLALAWEWPVDQLVDLSAEVEAWLNNRGEDASVPLRRAREAMAKYHKLKTRKESDRSKIKSLEESAKNWEQNAAYDKDTTKAIEASLLTQVEELNTKVAEYESQISTLRNELSRYQHTNNPLPPPPEPVPLDRFPAFARAAAAGTRIGPTPDPHGYANYFLSNADPPPADKGKGKGKGKERQHNIYAHPQRTADGIMPGASPSQRVVPPAKEDLLSADLTPRNAWRPVLAESHVPASAYVGGYADGFGVGYGAGGGLSVARDASALTNYQAYLNGTSSAVAGPSSGPVFSQSYAVPPSPPASLGDRDEPSGHANMSSVGEVLVNSVGSLGLYGVPAVPGHIDRPSSPVRFPHPQAVRLSRRHISEQGGYGTDDQSSSSRSQHPRSTAASTRPSAPRRSTVQPDGHLTDTEVTGTRPLDIQRRTAMAGGVHQDTTRQTHTHAHSLTNRTSMSSWGTVHTADTPRTGRGSISDLGLTSFPPVGAARASMHSDVEIRPNVFEPVIEEGAQTPVTRLHGILGSQSDLSTTLGMGNSALEAIASRRREAFDALTSGRPHQNTERVSSAAIAQQRHASQPVSSSSSRPPADSSIQRSHRVNRRREPSSSRRASIGIPVLASAPADMAEFGVNEEEEYFSTLSHTPPHMGNALGLDLNAPLQEGPRISAPTPRVSTQPFLRSWSMDSTGR